MDSFKKKASLTRAAKRYAQCLEDAQRHILSELRELQSKHHKLSQQQLRGIIQSFALQYFPTIKSSLVILLERQYQKTPTDEQAMKYFVKHLSDILDDGITYFRSSSDFQKSIIDE